MSKKLLPVIIAVLAFAVPKATFASAEFFGNAFVVLNLNAGGNVFYDLNPSTQTLNPNFGGEDLGTFDTSAGDSLLLNGAEFNTFTTSATR